jgi:RNA polymerase sigma-70 factor (ECF subfamily)
VTALEDLFSSGVVSVADGGGVARAARFPVLGRARVAVFVAKVSRTFWDRGDVSWVEANGRPAVMLSHHDRVIGVVAVEASAEGIDRVIWLVNPAKLAHFA